MHAGVARRFAYPEVSRGHARVLRRGHRPELGTREGRGRLYLLDADDLLEPDKIGPQIRLIEEGDELRLARLSWKYNWVQNRWTVAVDARMREKRAAFDSYSSAPVPAFSHYAPLPPRRAADLKLSFYRPALVMLRPLPHPVLAAQGRVFAGPLP